jgi:acyl dehydratase
VSERIRLVPGPEVPARYAEVSGDDSPLHLDDAAAAEAGLDGVILHGMYLFGLAVRAASADVDDDPRRIRSAGAQFRAPGVPGAELTVDVEAHAEDAAARVIRVRQNGVDLLRDARLRIAT